MSIVPVLWLTSCVTRIVNGLHGWEPSLTSESCLSWIFTFAVLPAPKLAASSRVTTVSAVPSPGMFWPTSETVVSPTVTPHRAFQSAADSVTVVEPLPTEFQVSSPAGMSWAQPGSASRTALRAARKKVRAFILLLLSAIISLQELMCLSAGKGDKIPLVRFTKAESGAQAREGERRGGEQGEAHEHAQPPVGRHLRRGEQAEAERDGEGVLEDGGPRLQERGPRRPVLPLGEGQLAALEEVDGVIVADPQSDGTEHRRRDPQGDTGPAHEAEGPDDRSEGGEDGRQP